MKITKKQLQEMVKAAVKTQLVTQPINEGAGNFMSRRELLNKARDASFKFENEIIKTLDLEDPNTMPIEKRTELLRIMRTMERSVVKAVAHAIVDINKAGIPTKANEPEKVAAEVAAAPPEQVTQLAAPVATAGSAPKAAKVGV